MTANSSVVTIITPLFNRQRLIQETIESVKQQTFSNWELFVVDDHSTDDSFRVASDLGRNDPRIRVWRRTDPQKGAPICRNEALYQSQAKFVMFLDSDDLVGPTCLENRIAKFDSLPDADFQLFPCEQFKSTPGDLKQPWFVDTDDPLTRYFSGPVWPINAALWNRESLMKLEGFRPDLLSWQDWDLYVRALIADFKYLVHSSKPDSFIRRSIHNRISRNAERDRLNLLNRKSLFRDLYHQMLDSGKLNDARRKAMVKMYVDLASKMLIAKMPAESNHWIDEVCELGLIAKDQVPATRLLAAQGSKLSMQQRINRWKLAILNWLPTQ